MFDLDRGAAQADARPLRRLQAAFGASVSAVRRARPPGGAAAAGPGPARLPASNSAGMDLPRRSSPQDPRQSSSRGASIGLCLRWLPIVGACALASFGAAVCVASLVVTPHPPCARGGIVAAAQGRPSIATSQSDINAIQSAVVLRRMLPVRYHRCRTPSRPPPSHSADELKQDALSPAKSSCPRYPSVPSCALQGCFVCLPCPRPRMSPSRCDRCLRITKVKHRRALLELCRCD